MVRIRELLDAYAWIHSPVLVRQATRVHTVPNLFLTSDCISRYVFVLRGKIGDWLVKHQDYWYGIDHSATGFAFPLRYTDPYAHPCTVDKFDFRTKYITEGYDISKRQRRLSLRECGDYTEAVIPYRCAPSSLFGDGELFGRPSGRRDSDSDSDSDITDKPIFLSHFDQSW